MKNVLKKWWLGGGLCAVLAACGPQGGDVEGLAQGGSPESSQVGLDMEVPSTRPQWWRGGAMVNPRALHTSTLLRDGRVLVVGGFNRIIELYDPVTSSFSEAAPTSTTRRYHTATRLVDGRVLVTGGSSRHGHTTEVYDPDTGYWSASGDMAESRRHHGAALLAGGGVLVSGGRSASGEVLGSAEVYDPATGTFSATGSMVHPRQEHELVTLEDGRVLAVGGVDASGQWLASAEVYEPATGTWTLTGYLALARRHHSATLLKDGRVLVLGGAGGSGQSSSAEVYHPDSGTWSATGPMLHPRSYHAAVRMWDGKVMVSGGYDGRTGIVATTELFDPRTGTFHEAPTMVADRYKHTLTLLADGRVVAVGGYGNNGNQGSAEVYDPRRPMVAKLLDAQPPTWVEGGPGCRTFGKSVQWVYRSRADQVMLLSRDASGTSLPYFDELAVVKVTHTGSYTSSAANLHRYELNCAEPGVPTYFLDSEYAGSSQPAFNLAPLFGGGTGWFKVELEVRNFYYPYAWQSTYLIRQP